MAKTQIFGMCALWLWPWRYDVGSRLWHTPLGHGQQLCEILSRLDMWLRSYGPNTNWTDRQGDSYMFIPPVNFVCRGGYKNMDSSCTVSGKKWAQFQKSIHFHICLLFSPKILVYLHSVRCFPSLRNEKRHCCYNVITTISHVISSEGIHGMEKYVWTGLLLLLKIPEIHLDSHFKVSEWT